MTRKQKQAIAAVDLGNASFYQWFIAQYGERPSKEPTSELALRASDAQAAYRVAAAALGAVNAWENLRDSALKAWQAREDQKK